MRFNLQLAYLGLLSVTCISSCLLFFVLLTENAKYVAACSEEGTVLRTEIDAAANEKAAVPPDNHAAADTAPVTPVTNAHEDVLPNYKKVKKILNNEGEESIPAIANELHNLHVVDNIEAAASAESSLLPNDVVVERASSASASGSVADANVLINEVNIVNINEVHEQKQLNENEENTATEVPAIRQTDDLRNVATQDNMPEGLPDITEIPTITVTELPLEILEPTRGNIDALIIDAAKETIAREHENHTIGILENDSEVIRKDEEIIKFDDSGGAEKMQPTQKTDADLTSNEIPQNIPMVNGTNAVTPTPPAAATGAGSTNENENQATANTAPPTEELTTGDDNAANTVNLTVEEVPIPVFSEWAQKQMEEAEKQQAKEQEEVNTSTQKKNLTNGDGKRAAPLKMRNKNYASPDCGAKIIASNADATNTGAVLSASKDEYMLSPCGNRIWFVVELCEAIQAQKVELANFELFSSSPKNFTVAVSNRFPTRDWSNVGSFIAEDKRSVQSFDLHPHLFGKFVRVDIHSHYSKEHFCPVSLFRVFGTSEFEAFETENTPDSDLDDFDDDFVLEQMHVKSSDMNLFKSASDAVLSIVKKAAEVLVKPVHPQNTTQPRASAPTPQCRTPATGQYSCTDCNQPLVARINNALSCEYEQLQTLLKVPWLRKDLLRTRICAKDYGIELKGKDPIIEDRTQKQTDVKHSYYLNMLPPEYVGALCQMLATQERATASKTTTQNSRAENMPTEPPLNLTIEKKLKKNDLRVIDGMQRKLITPETITESAETCLTGEGTHLRPSATTTTTTTGGGAVVEDEQLTRPPLARTETTTDATTQAPPYAGGSNEPMPDVNIFNVPADTEAQEEKQAPASETTESSHNMEFSSGDHSGDSDYAASTSAKPPPSSTDAQHAPPEVVNNDNALPSQPIPTITTATTTPPPSPPVPSTRSEEDAASWENIDHLITSTTAAPVVGDRNVPTNQPGVNFQQKIPSGPQSESVFIRLSNRIKALERNMSLSGQYLEELSRRYKKQVEELQLTLTQTVQTVRTLEEQSRRQSELHQMLAQRNAELKDELDDLSLQVHACIVVIIFVGAFVFLLLLVSILVYRSMRRETREVLTLYHNANKRKTANAVAAMQRKLNRRKSYEDFSDHQQSGEKVRRRPSEEALMILKERSDDAGIETVGDTAKNLAQRERKISICYGNNMMTNGGGQMHQTSTPNAPPNAKQRRRGEKHSWPNTEHAQQQARRHLAQLNVSTDSAAEFRDSFDRVNGRPPRAPPLSSGSENQNKSAGSKTKRKFPAPRRQTSLSDDFMGTTSLSNTNTPMSAADIEYDESLRLEEDDLDNFIPTSDLAYNEFMPEGPSGYQVEDNIDATDGGHAESKKAGGKRLSRLSAPAFFKSPFGKSRNKLRNSKSAKHPHESTSWEWYRSKNAESTKPLSGSVSASGGFMRASPTVSLDSSSLSEILLPNSRTENSFRILEEAILSSGESIAASSVATTGTNVTDNVF